MKFILHPVAFPIVGTLAAILGTLAIVQLFGFHVPEALVIGMIAGLLIVIPILYFKYR